MTSVKYTKDGRKVAVIGKLNSQESIVQEIFISNGGEIPSGEQFVVKGLLDAPMVSWKERRINEIEETYEKTRIETSAEIERLRNTFNQKKKLLSALISKTTEYINIVDGSELATVKAFMEGRITHVVTGNYGPYKIASLEDLLESKGRYNSDRIKLITLFGKARCGFEWRLNRYSDGSGGYETIIPCESLDAAKKSLEDLMRGRVREGRATKAMIDAKKEYGLSFPCEEEIKNYIIHESQVHKGKIDEYKRSIKLEMERMACVESHIVTT